MTGVVPEAIEAYAAEHTRPGHPLLADVAAETLATEKAHGMMVGLLEGRFLETLVWLSGARRILEIGCFTGYSALSMAAALPPEGTIVTCELDPERAAAARRHFDASPWADQIEIRIGPALDSLRDLDGPFDLVFIDADKPSNPDYFAWALALSRRGSLIVVDNVVRGGAVTDAASDDPRVQGVRRSFDLLKEEHRVSTTAIQTVGSKGWDGFVLALVVGA